MLRRHRFALALLLAAATTSPVSAQEAVLWPGELSGRVALSAPEVAPGLQQGALAGALEPIAARVVARSVLDAPTRLGGEDAASAGVLIPGPPASSWSADWRLIVPPRGGALAVSAEIALAGGARYWTTPTGSECLPLCNVVAGAVVDAGCDASCASCLPCDPLPSLTGVDQVESVAFLRVTFTHACRDAALAPTMGQLAAFHDDGDGQLGPADVLRADVAITNPDTGGPALLELVVPAGLPLVLSGRAALGARSVDLSFTEDPRAAGTPLILAPGEMLTVQVGPLAGADLPPAFVVLPSDPRVCDPAPLGALRGSFDLADATPRPDTTLLALTLASALGPSDSGLTLVDPLAIPPGGIAPSGTAQAPTWEIQGLLPNLSVPAELVELEGLLHATTDLGFSIRPGAAGASQGLALGRGSASGFSGALALLANDPVFDPTACGLDPLDPATALIAAQAALVPLVNPGASAGLESLNSAAHRACDLEGPTLAISADRRDDLVTELPSFATNLRPARVDGLLRILDATVLDDATILEIGVERALVLESFELGPTTSLRSVGARGLSFEATRGTWAETVPETLDVAALTPPQLDAERERLGMPGVEDPSALQQADLVSRGVSPEPDLSIEDNRAALDASETYLRHAQVVALAANLPGPVTTREYGLELDAERLESRLDEGGITVRGRLRIVDVTKPSHRSATIPASSLAGALPSTFPGPAFPSIALPLTLLQDADGLIAGTDVLTAVPSGELLLDPAISDGSFRHGEAWSNDGPDTTTDTEPVPDADPDDNDANLDPASPRNPLLVKPDDDLSTRSRLLDRLTLEPGEESVENFAACFGAVRLVVRAAAGYRLESASVTGRGVLDAEGRAGSLANLRPDLGTDLNEDGVADQYFVFFDDAAEGEGFHGRPRGNGLGAAATSIVMFLPAGDYVLEPHGMVKDSPTGQARAADFPPLEVSVACGELTLVTDGDPACPLTQGFWKRQCAGPHPSGEDQNLPLYVDLVNDRATFADVADVAMLCDRLHPSPEEDKCEQAEAQFMAAVLNLASGRVGPNAVVELADVGGSDAPDVATAEELIAAIDVLLANPARTVDDCRLAQELAAAFNERRVTPASAACDGTVAAADPTMEEGEGPPPPVDNSVRLWKVPEGLRMRWNDLPPGRAGSYEVVEHAFNQGVPPAEWVMDGLADIVLTTISGELGETIPMPPGQLMFYKVRGLSPVLGIPGPTRARR